MKILLPASFPLALDLPGDVEAVGYDQSTPIPAEHHDAEILVEWQTPVDVLATNAAALTSLRWAQTLMAGPDAMLAAGFAAGTVITNGVGLHDGPVAEHALGLILAAARRLDVSHEARLDRRWASEQSVAQPLDNSERFSMIAGAKVVIWGFGGIGQRTGRYLRALGADVTGVARTAGERDGTPVVATADLPRVLADADVLVSVLPTTPQTMRVIDADVFATLPPKAWFVNVGRGATVNEADLLSALRDGVIAGAAIDVAAVEPAPADWPLWEAPNLILTPHSAGGRPQGAGALIEENLRRLRAREGLRNTVPRD